MTRKTRNATTIKEKIEAINNLSITRAIMKNGKMNRMNLPAEIYNLREFSSKIKVATEIDFAEMTITWMPKITDVKIVVG